MRRYLLAAASQGRRRRVTTVTTAPVDDGGGGVEDGGDTEAGLSLHLWDAAPGAAAAGGGRGGGGGDEPRVHLPSDELAALFRRHHQRLLQVRGHAFWGYAFPYVRGHGGMHSRVCAGMAYAFPYVRAPWDS